MATPIDPPVLSEPAPEDAAKMAAFFHRMMNEVFRDTFPEAAVAHYLRTCDEDSIRRDIEDADKVILQACAGEKIVGLLLGSAMNGGVASVVWLTVDPESHGHGIGRRLMEEAFLRYREMGAHKCVVYTETASAKAFYERIGMNLEGEHPDHWWGCRHYCLGKSLREGNG